jgi:hypothetical protein
MAREKMKAFPWFFPFDGCSAFTSTTGGRASGIEWLRKCGRR